MDLTDQEIELLEDFWAGLLLPEAEEALKSRLQSDPAFKKAADQWYLFVQAMAPGPEDEAMRDEIRKKLPVPTPVMPTNRLRYWIFGALLLLLVIALVWFNTGKQLNPTKHPQYYPIAQQFFKAERLSSGTLGQPQNTPTHPDFLAARRAYAGSEFRGAATAWTKYQENTGDENYLLFAAEAWFMAGFPAEARPLYEKLMQQKIAGVDLELIKWHLALSYASEGNVNQAMKLAEEIRREGGEFAVEAEEFSRRLREMD